MGLITEINIEKVEELLEGSETFSAYTEEDREVAFILDPETHILRAAEKCPRTGTQIGGTIVEIDLSSLVETISDGLTSFNNGQSDALEG